MKRLITCIILSCACAIAQAQDMYIKTIAGCDSIGGFGGDGGPAINAKLFYPEGINFDREGNLLIADLANNRIRKMSLSTGIITTIAGNDTFGYFGDGIPATAASLWYPEDVLMDTEGNIFIADGLNNRIRKISTPSGVISTVAGNGTAGDVGDNAEATNAELNLPGGLCLDRAGNIYVADSWNNKIRKVDAVTGIITTIAGTGAAGNSGIGGLAINAELNQPSGIFFDRNDNLIVCDANNNQIKKIDMISGLITVIAGAGTAGYSGDGGLATRAKLNSPARGCTDNYGNLYFAEYCSGVVRRIDVVTGIITTVAGNGNWGFSGDNGPATNARAIPAGVVVDSLGVTYISDFGNNRVRVLYSPLAVSPSPAIPDIAVYPNPVTNVLNIEHAQGCELHICNLVGLPVFHAKILTEQWAGDISALPDGVYIAQFTDEYGAIVSKKIVKE